MAVTSRVYNSLTEDELLSIINRLQGTSYLSVADWQTGQQGIQAAQEAQDIRLQALEDQLQALLGQQSGQASNAVQITIT
jgi:hypothetical protein